VLFTSCIPTRDLTYLQGDENAVEQAVNPVSSKPYRLQTNDILSITIKALDNRFVDIFQPTASSTPLKSEQSLYFDGFAIDDHGNIRMPIIDEVNVLGLTVDEARQLI